MALSILAPLASPPASPISQVKLIANLGCWRTYLGRSSYRTPCIYASQMPSCAGLQVHPQACGRGSLWPWSSYLQGCRSLKLARRYRQPPRCVNLYRTRLCSGCLSVSHGISRRLPPRRVSLAARLRDRGSRTKFANEGNKTLREPAGGEHKVLLCCCCCPQTRLSPRIPTFCVCRSKVVH